MSTPQDNLCRPIFQRMNGDLSYNTHHIHPTLPHHCQQSIASKLKTQPQCRSTALPYLGHMMHSISMMHQLVKHSLGHREAPKHCVTVLQQSAHTSGSGSQVPGLDPSCDVQVSTQHHCRHAAHPPFQPQPRCCSSASSFRNAVVHIAPTSVSLLRQNTFQRPVKSEFRTVNFENAVVNILNISNLHRSAANPMPRLLPLDNSHTNIDMNMQFIDICTEHNYSRR